MSPHDEFKTGRGWGRNTFLEYLGRVSIRTKSEFC